MTKGRTPLKTPPLHNPGESLQENLDDLLSVDAAPYLAFLVVLPIWIVMEWIRYLLPGETNPTIWTAVAAVFCVFSVFKLRKIRRKARDFVRGIQAEKVVGQYLEQFREQGYQIFHDIPGESGGRNFNLDLMIIGPRGIFTIETKYARKPEKGRGEVLYDGQHITVQGFRPDRDPVVQAKAQAKWLFELLKLSTGKGIFVKPVVIYPGWWVENKVRDADVWVINEKALASFIGNQKFELSDSDVHLASFHLNRYIQSTLK